MRQIIVGLSDERKRLVFTFKKNALFHGSELLGEVSDGQFVPSLLLLEKPPLFQKLAHAFVLKLQF